MTDNELEGMARQALNMARTDMEQGKKFIFLVAMYLADGGLLRMREVAQRAAKLLGDDDWVGLEHADIGFRFIREELFMAEAIVFVLAVKTFRPSPAFYRLPRKEQDRLMRAGDVTHQRMVERGLLTICDGLHGIAQTPERVCTCMQFNGQEKIETEFCDQSGFRGPLKMFGEER